MFIESLALEVRKEIVWVAGVSSLMCRASAGKSQKLEVTGQLGWNPCRAPSLVWQVDAHCYLAPQLKRSTDTFTWPFHMACVSSQCGSWAPRVGVPKNQAEAVLSFMI